MGVQLGTLFIVAACATVLAGAVDVPAVGAASVPVGTVEIFPDSTVNGPVGIVNGPDGALWFVNHHNDSIGRIDPDTHVITNFTDPTIDDPYRITNGPDGALWFSNYVTGSIGRITTGGVVTNFPVGPGIFDIETGPDNALWFTEPSGQIGRMLTDGSFTEYSGGGVNQPIDIVTGPDGALWFTNYGGNTIGRIDATSHTITNVPDADISGPYGIVVGPDGALWYTNQIGNSIGRVTTGGSVTDYTDATIDQPSDIVVGPDDALWFTNSGNDSIGRIDPTTHLVTNYTGTGVSHPYRLVAGPDGSIWFTNYLESSIGRLQAAPPSSDHLVVLFDSSASTVRPRTRKADFVNAYNEAISSHRADDSAQTVDVVVFSRCRLSHPFANAPITDVPTLKKADYRARCRTPLYDTVGQVIGYIATHYPGDDITVVVITDYKDNASVLWTRTSALALVDDKTAIGWSFEFPLPKYESGSFVPGGL